jgi:hypothetical protein
MLRNASMAPAWIEVDKEVLRQLAERDGLLARARGAGSVGKSWRRRQMTAIVAAANRAVGVLNVEAPTARQHRRPLDLDAGARTPRSGRARRPSGGPRLSRPRPAGSQSWRVRLV